MGADVQQPNLLVYSARRVERVCALLQRWCAHCAEHVPL